MGNIIEKLGRQITDLYSRIRKLELSGGGSGIPDAPSDGQMYVRQGGQWVVLSASGVIPTLQQVCEASTTESLYAETTLPMRVTFNGGSTTLSGIEVETISAGKSVAITPSTLEYRGTGQNAVLKDNDDIDTESGARTFVFNGFAQGQLALEP